MVRVPAPPLLLPLVSFGTTPYEPQVSNHFKPRMESEGVRSLMVCSPEEQQAGTALLSRKLGDATGSPSTRKVNPWFESRACTIPEALLFTLFG